MPAIAEPADPKVETPPIEPAAPAPQPEKTEKPEVAKPEPDPAAEDRMSSARQSFADRLRKSTEAARAKPEPEKQEPEKPEPPKKDEKPPKETTPVALKAKPKGVAQPKAEPKPATQPVFDAEQMARTVTTAATEAVTRVVTDLDDKRRKETPAPTSDIDPKHLKNLPIIERMEQMNGESYKGLADRVKKAAGQATIYEKKWLEEHPGEEFDAADSQHEKFFDSIEVDYDDVDFSRAIASMENEKLVEERVKPFKDKLTELEDKEFARELQPKLHKRGEEASISLAHSLDDQLKGLKPQDFNPESEAFKKLQSSDPVLASATLGAVANIQDFTSTAIQLLDHNDRIRFDEKNSSHQQLLQFLIEKEEEIQAMPAEDQLFEGKRFISRPQYFKLPQEDRSKYWILNSEWLIDMRVRDAGEFLKKYVSDEKERIKNMAKSYGFAAPVAAPVTQNGGPAKPAEAKPVVRKPVAPAAIARTEIPPAPVATEANPQTLREKFLLGLRGK